MATPRKPNPRGLNHAQEEHLRFIRESDEAWRRAKRFVEAEVRRKVQESLEQYALVREQAVWRGVQLGIPKARIMREGLGTTSPNTVYDILHRVEEAQAATGVALPDAAVAPYVWLSVHQHPTSHLWYAYLDAGDDHQTTQPAEFAAPGWMFLQDRILGWIANPVDKPGQDVVDWVHENPPTTTGDSH